MRAGGYAHDGMRVIVRFDRCREHGHRMHALGGRVHVCRCGKKTGMWTGDITVHFHVTKPEVPIVPRGYTDGLHVQNNTHLRQKTA